MKKSISQRIRITRRGKAVRRPMGVGHFRTRKSTGNVRDKRKQRGLDYPLRNIIPS